MISNSILNGFYQHVHVKPRKTGVTKTFVNLEGILIRLGLWTFTMYTQLYLKFEKSGPMSGANKQICCKIHNGMGRHLKSSGPEIFALHGQIGSSPKLFSDLSIFQDQNEHILYEHR